MARKIPLGVNIISILIILGAILQLLLAGILVFGGAVLSNIELLGGLGVVMYIVAGGLALVAILNIIIAIALRRGKNWARWLLIVFHSIGIILGIIAIFTDFAIMSIFSILFSTIVVLYLLLSKKVKAFF